MHMKDCVIVYLGLRRALWSRGYGQRAARNKSSAGGGGGGVVYYRRKRMLAARPP